MRLLKKSIYMKKNCWNTLLSGAQRIFLCFLGKYSMNIPWLLLDFFGYDACYLHRKGKL